MDNNVDNSQFFIELQPLNATLEEISDRARIYSTMLEMENETKNIDHVTFYDLIEKNNILFATQKEGASNTHILDNAFAFFQYDKEHQHMTIIIMLHDDYTHQEGIRSIARAVAFRELFWKELTHSPYSHFIPSQGYFDNDDVWDQVDAYAQGLVE